MIRALGIDLGLSGVRAAVIDGTGRVLGAGAETCVHRSAGLAEHDPRTWLAEVEAAVRRAVRAADADPVDSIAVGALGPAPVLLDAALEPLLPAPLFSLGDRAEPYRQELAGELAVDIGPDHVLPRLRAWSRSEPSAIKAAAWVVDATGYIVNALVGRPVMDRITVTDYVAAGATLPVPTPTAEEPSAMAGGLAAEVAGRLGLRPGTPVTVGTYDTFVDLAALPAGPSEVVLILGSTLVIGTVADAPVIPEGLRTSPHVGEGTFIGGWTSTAGSALDWSSALVARDETTPHGGDTSDEPGAHGLVALPYLAGERAPVWDAHASGVVVGLTLATTPAHVARAFLDGVALSTLDLFDRLRPVVGDTPRVWVTGGGARNDAWLRATADALGMPLDVALELTGGVAAARFALDAVGAPAPPVKTRRVDPDLARHDRYRQLAGIYARLYPALRGEMHALRKLARAPTLHGEPT